MRIIQLETQIKKSRKVLLYSLIIIIGFSFKMEILRSQVKYAWVLGDGEKVFREDTRHPDKNGNNIWDGKTIKLTGLYNEILAFQLIAEVDSAGATAVEVAVHVQLPKEDAGGLFVDRRQHEELTKTKRTRF